VVFLHKGWRGKSGGRFSLNEKQKVIEEVSRDVKKCKIMRKHGISLSVLSTFITDRARIEKNIDSDAVGLQRT
jgi:hypothetical protein